MNIPLNKFEDWLTSKNLKKRTIDEYLYYFMKFNYPIYNQDSVARFLKDNKNRVARSFLANLKEFLKSNYEELGITNENRVKIIEVELPKLTGREKKTIVKALPQESIPKLEAALETEKEKLELLISYYCGLRLGELLKITIMSFNWDDWKKDQEKMGECIVYGKGNKQGIALVPSFLMKRIARYIRNNRFNSVNSRLFIRDGEVNIKNLGREWQNKLREAGIKSGVTKLNSDGSIVSGTNVHPHKLRHSYAIHLKKDLNLDIRDIQELLRHSSIQSTQIYTQVDKEDLKEKLKKI